MSNRTIDLAAELHKLETIAMEGGELTPEMVKDTIDGLEGMIEDKFDATMYLIRQFNTQAEFCDKESKRIAERKKSWEGQADVLKAYLLNCLLAANRDKLKTTLNTFTARKGTVRLVIDDVKQLPDQFVDSWSEVITQPKNDQIKAAIEEAKAKAAEMEKNGEVPPPELLNPVPGAHLETGSRALQVR
ncbi:siphovirus Gp157 family protein [Serratia fonticola]